MTIFTRRHRDPELTGDEHVLLDVERSRVERPTIAEQRDGLRGETPSHQDTEGVRKHLRTERVQGDS